MRHTVLKSLTLIALPQPLPSRPNPVSSAAMMAMAHKPDRVADRLHCTGRTLRDMPANQEVVYGVGSFDLTKEPIVFQVPDFGAPNHVNWRNIPIKLKTRLRGILSVTALLFTTVIMTSASTVHIIAAQ